MKRQYITTQILLACLSKPKPATQDIHTQLRETIAQHKRMVKEWEKEWRTVTAKEIIMSTTKAA